MSVIWTVEETRCLVKANLSNPPNKNLKKKSPVRYEQLNQGAISAHKWNPATMHNPGNLNNDKKEKYKGLV